MSSLVCRVCRGNVRLQSIGHSGLQEMYGRITRSEHNSAVGRRITICHTCVSQLQRFRRLTDVAHRAKGMREELSKRLIEITGRNIAMLNLETTPLLSVCVVGHVTLTDYSGYSVKVESADEDDDLTDIDRSMDDIAQGDSIINEGQLNAKNNNMKNCANNADQFYYCDTCNTKCNTKHICFKTFNPFYNMKRHMRTHTEEKPFGCKRCKKTFCRVSHLTRHMRTHTGEKPFGCIRCEKTFCQASQLTIHMRTHTGEKPFACNRCEKTFCQASHLTRHMRTHTGEKPHACNRCEKTFNESSDLTKHMRTHTGENPFACKRCGKTFCRVSHLTRHMRTHTGEKPYACKTCEKTFSEASSLTRHMRTHKRIVEILPL